MIVGIFINHPADVHFWKNISKGLEKRGHKVILLARDYGETIQLLNELRFNFLIYSSREKSKFGKILNLPLNIFKAIRKQLRFPPDIILGFGIYSVFSSVILRRPCIVFSDSEPRIRIPQFIQFKAFMPFVETIITPNSFLDALGSKQIKINSYKELAYLHPNYYRPNEDIYELLKLKRKEDYALIRFNDFDAAHDFGIKGFSLQNKITLVKLLNKYVKVFISFEGEIIKELNRYKLKIPKNRIHDVLYHAKLFVCDTQTMATEAAILGTPVIRSNSFVGKKDMGNFIELEKKYGLIFNIRNPEKAIKKAEDLIQNSNLKKEWRYKRERLLKEKCDITKFMVWFIENYPQSIKDIKENPNIFDSYV